MKKLKLILPVFMAFVMSFSVVSASACKKKKPAEKPPIVEPDTPEPDKPTPSTPEIVNLRSIKLDTANAQLVFEQGEAFNAEGLVIQATYLMSVGDDTTANLTVASEGVTVDSTSYNMAVIGSYPISVSYTYKSLTRTANYTVTVVEPAKAGLNVTYKAGFNNIIALTTENKTADLSGVTNNIEVRQSDENGVVDDKTPIITTGYTVKVFKDKTEVTDLTAVDGGVYQIWVSMPHEKNPSYTLESFVLFYVTDPLLSLAKTSTGDTTQQLALTDSISKNWTFEATYVSGKTEQLTIDDVVVLGFDATYMGDNKATVSYSKNDGAGNIVTKTVEVDYSITAPDGLVTLNRAMNLAKIQEKILADDPMLEAVADQTKLTASAMDTDANRFIKLLDGTHNIRPANSCIEIKGDALSVKFNGAGTLKISAASTGGSNWSAIAVKDSNGNYLPATYTAANACTTNVENVYAVKTTSEAEFTFAVAEAGDYIICGVASKEVNPTDDTAKNTDRNTRIKAISVVDKVGTAPSGETTTTNTFDYSAITPITDQTEMTQEMFTGKNAFLTLVSGGSCKYRIESKAKAFEIKKAAISVTFNGTGTLKVTVSSSGSSNWSIFALKDGAGNYVEATYTESALIAKIGDTEVYAVNNTTKIELTFNITAAGTYTLCGTTESEIVPATGATTKSGTRVHAIEMVDKTGSAAVEPTEYTFDYSAITPIADKAAITQEMLTGKNAFLTLGGGTLNYRTSGGGCVEIKDNGLTVTFNGTGTLKIKVASTGGTNWSAIAVKDASGNYVSATYTDGETTSTTGTANVYAVYGTTYVEFTFNITAAGTYTICTINSTVTKAEGADTGRNTRINAITMIDNNSEEA